MSHEDFNTGFVVAFMWIVIIILSILSGVLAWKWIEPESFLGGVGFLILWGILTKISHFITGGIFSLFLNRRN